MSLEVEVPDYSERVSVVLTGENDDTGGSIVHAVDVPVSSISSPVNKQQWIEEAVVYLKRLADRAASLEPGGEWDFRISIRWSVPHNVYEDYVPE